MMNDELDWNCQCHNCVGRYEKKAPDWGNWFKNALIIGMCICGIISIVIRLLKG